MSKPPTPATPGGSLTPESLEHVNPAIVEALEQSLVNNQIERMEAAMLEHDQVEIPVREFYFNGMYAREIVIPADTLLTGRVHKHQYLDIMVSGDIVVATPDGVVHMTGYNVCDGQPGRKRAGYALTDTTWITVHRTDVFEPDMENRLTFWSMDQYRRWQLEHQ